MKIVTKGFGDNNSWKFGNCKSTQKYESYETNFDKCCQPPGTYELVCKDGEKWVGGAWRGGYIEIGEKRYCENFTQGEEESHEVAMSGRRHSR